MRKKAKKLNFWNVMLLIACFFFLIFFIYPVANILKESMLDKSGSFSLAAFKKFWSRKYYTSAIWNSLAVSSVSTIFSCILGFLFAYFVTTVKIRGMNLVNTLLMVSFVSPPFIGAYSWIVLAGRNGVLTSLLNNLFHTRLNGIYGFWGIVLVFSVKMVPLVYLYVKGALKNMDNSLLEAAENMGGRRWGIVLKIMMPLVMPTLLASMLLVFMRCFADFGTPMLIGEGYRTLPVLVYNTFVSDVGKDVSFAAAISVIMIVFTAAIFLIQRYVTSKMTVEMSALHPVSPRKESGAKNVLVHAYVYFLTFMAILPLLVIFYNSFQKTNGIMFVDGFSLDSYRKAFDRMGTAIVNTFTYSTIAIIIILILGVTIGYLTIRRKNALTGMLDTVVMFPYIVPGSVMGIALLVAFNKRPLLLTGTAVIMLLAYILRRLPYTVRSSAGFLKQINPSIDEASLSLGATSFTTLRSITLPMMAPGVISGALMSWITVVTELSSTIFLNVTATQTLTIAIYTEVVRTNFGTASALSMILCASTTVVLMIFFKLTGKKEIDVG
ncbi:MAG: iron ABC transporter permease [Clostridia bacterium]|nr:iron ABC transporter permease [Clostridia bacterium]